MQASVYVGFILSGQTLVATGVSGPLLSRLYYIRDTHTGVRFLLDTGSKVSVIPPSHEDRTEHNSKTIVCMRIFHIPNDCFAAWHLPFLGPHSVRATATKLQVTVS